MSRGGCVLKGPQFHTCLILTEFGVKGFGECVFLNRLGALDGEEMKGGKRDVGCAEDLN